MSKSLFKSTARVGVNTTLSRVLGFVRDIVIARAFGAGTDTDAFFVAFRIPNLLRRLFAEGAFATAFVPVLSEYKTQRSHEEVQALVAHVAGALGAVLFLVTAVGVAAAPVIVLIFAPGFLGTGDQFDLTVAMVRVTFPYILFISLTAFAGGILNTYGRFGVPAFTPVLLNLSLIGAALWLAPRMDRPVVALAWGVFAAGIVQLGFQLPFLKRLGFLVRPRLRRGHEGVKRILKLIIPATVGVSVAQVNLLVDTLIASFLVSGSISWLYYSDRMVEFPLGVFGIALATVILPSLSRQHAAKSPQEFSLTLDWALRLVLVVGTPAALGLAALASPILTTLFQYGEFGRDDVRLATLSLIAYSSGLLAFIGVKVLAPGFYARQDMKTPVRIAIIAMLSNIVLNLALVVPLKHAGLALATSISSYLNALLLYRVLLQQGVLSPLPGWGVLFVKVALANLAMLAALSFLNVEEGVWFGAAAPDRALRLAVLVAAGAAVYGAALLALGLRPRHLMRSSS
ncbi:MAG TPA: murein biosynthesis integral membrane protein MurJ [Gammaproteobacteria bacterium]